ncbi:IDO-domain-containing protein [Basidiobolus meristosporus CBS 931.73]|uniref:IDO-domain-containing protein n=1 Tax=Basidiobolus meristosporus CBS 931.73 TaxID=1314790 RepID=A0A1Y1YWU0_9FUNG|nr:IDO-domain-containing protein [Basidiobolus meristosporus CBS 931.73]|eukprot:ORY02025.1 IDO-domain-containing protein [Basidiobolus meristosporus CBS 931.73]
MHQWYGTLDVHGRLIRVASLSPFRQTGVCQNAQPVSPSHWENVHPDSQFIVTPQNGFLPREDPLVKLPSEFKVLESLLDRMPLKLPDGSNGLLWKGELGQAVTNELPLYDVDHIQDNQLLSALYRDYTFLASAYLLEPCDINFRTTGDYGLARDVLPKNIAIPLAKVSEKIGAKPFMEYAMSYSLYNYQRIDKSKPADYPNLNLVRGFAGAKSEHGFILVHVAMVAHSGKVVDAALRTLDAARQGDRAEFNKQLSVFREVFAKINQVMETMWSRSEPADYPHFRTFIMGSKSQPMFPNGILYEGVSSKPLYFRGESGANDSMIPLADNLLELTSKMPTNPLTEVLRDFRSYRPVNHNRFLKFVEDKARDVGVRQFAEEDGNSAAIYLQVMDQVRDFRHRHWMFTKEYILKRMKHPVATGGSPIVTWLPNQLGAVLDSLVNTAGKALTKSEITPANRTIIEEILRKADAERRILTREVSYLVEERGAKAAEVEV